MREKPLGSLETVEAQRHVKRGQKRHQEEMELQSARKRRCVEEDRVQLQNISKKPEEHLEQQVQSCLAYELKV